MRKWVVDRMTEEVGRPPAMTDEQVTGLRAAFAAEVTSRMADLLPAAAQLRDTGDVASAQTVSLHAHTLASGAVIVGEDLAAYHARRCEQALQPHLDAGTDPIPSDAARIAAEAAETLGVLLGPWVGSDVPGE